MASVNKITLVGNLGADPEIRYMPDGTPTATIRLATTEKWKDKQSGENREHTEWHRVVFYRGLADIVGKYTKSGSQVYIEGKNRTRKWTDKDGIERYTTEVHARELQMLGKKADNAPSPTPPADDAPPPSADDMQDSDVPF